MRTRFSRGLSAALAVSALSLTAACGGGDSDGAKKDGADKPAASASASATSAAPQPAGPLTDAQMKAAALDAKDLPAGWKAGKVEKGPAFGKADKPECVAVTDLFASAVKGATTGADLHFTQGKNTTLDQQVLTFPGAGAADFAKAVGAAADGCTSFNATAEGMKLKGTVKKLTAPAGAEEAHAIRVTVAMPDMGYQTQVDLLVARQGSGVTRIAFDPANDATGHKDFDALAKATVEKFAKAAQG
ncbi:hypothetical protein ACIRSU_17695 [Streptomyces sp. NPDC101160]|uniref:hypothetical protein n=1 Tax=Streptomyces sp. NPDC101160 TaxID=3366118 RepID=UPI003808059C